LTDIQQYPP